MKLYKDFKNEMERAHQEASDKDYLNNQEVVIIYEERRSHRIINILLLIGFLAVLGGSILFGLSI